MAQIEEKTGDVRVGYLVDIIVKEGELEVRSEPSGAKVYIDGKEAGETPTVLSNIRVGGHVVRIGKEGHEPYEEQVKVGEGERKKVSVSLKKIVGALLVNTDPPGATIFIDGKPVGVSPYEGKDLPSGTHQIKVIKEDYETWEREVVVEAGKGVEVFTMLREKKKAEPPKAKEPKVIGIPKVPRELDLAKKSCEAPVWKLGEKWTYKNVTGVIWTKEVVEVTEDLFITKTTGIKPLFGYDKKTLKCTFIIEDGKKVKNTDPFRGFFDFPIFVGKKWSYPSKSTPNENKVEGVEEIIVPAGSFMAYKIYYVQKRKEPSPRPDMPAEGWQRYWFSPEVKNYVKREIEKSGFWDDVKGLYDAELISYSLK